MGGSLIWTVLAASQIMIRFSFSVKVVNIPDFDLFQTEAGSG
jgi:hypothetical protein